ncbi:ATP-binding protein [Blastococcus sp. PRF04-17]|uniref:ATP-binding protein n=1 Tax=Blastococcus sp. PRF04-17 TaxID=2933797 RepID=UPI001FF42C03|nr:tetratricopeptide repeat protein [Blastococcus sp. PRF04-17]UOY02377.1 tetratricopeptide repeat protein [Blastococcus sp. PRF04-17]
MGLHTGEPTPHEEGYVGLDVHLAARVAGLAHGGQVVLTEATRRIAGTKLPPGTSVVDLGLHRLKDFPEPERLHQLTVEGAPREFPPLRSLGRATHLPTPATSLVGRDGDVAALRALLTSGGARVATLTGPGGAGKTRLAIAAATALADDFPDGVWFVPLEAATTAELMWASIADNLGLPPSGRNPGDVVAFLAAAPSLLVLDNLEQLPGAGEVVARLLTAPGARVLATSRRPLHVPGEHQHPVAPLGEPAVDLFVQRARMVRPGFAPDDAELAAVAEICGMLDGLPLAIELAAARVKVFGPTALRSRLAAGLELAAGRLPVPDRHRTLHDTVAWSYGMLDGDLQHFFRQLGAFGGDFDLDAAAAVVPDHPDPLVALEDLLDASLVTVIEGVDGEPRFRLLVTIAGFARRQLAESGEREAACRRHGEHYVALAEAVAPQLQTSLHSSAKDRIGGELDNLRAVLDWALPASGTPGPGLVLGLRLCRALYRYWYTCGHQAEGRRWLAQAVASSAGQESPESTNALRGLGVLLVQHGEFAAGRDALQRALVYWRREGQAGETVRTLSSLAIAHRALEEPGTARRLLDEAVGLARGHGEDQLLAAALSNLAIMDVDENRPAAALERLTQALTLDRKLGDDWAVVADQLNIAAALLQLGRTTEAYETARAVADEAVALEDPDMTIALLELLAWAFAGLGDPRRAALMLGAATALRESADLPIDPPDAALLERSLQPVRRPGDEEAWAADLVAGAQAPMDELLAEAFPPAGSRR